MSDTKRPREYYVSELKFEPESEPRQVSIVRFSESSDYVCVPVIERSAYEQLEQELAEVKDSQVSAMENLTKERDQLREEVDLYQKVYGSFDPDSEDQP